MLDIGDTLQKFDLPTNGDGTLSNKNIKGKKVILYFYPKDMTPGCTIESEDFRDNLKASQKADTMIIGVSKDSVVRHDKFVAKHDLSFQLISDETGTLCKDFGVWVEKNMYGCKYMGIQRATFLIDASGKIAQAWQKVKVKGHVSAVLEASKAL